MLFKKIILFFVLVSLIACEKNNPDPAWIQVNKWTLVENPDSQYPVGELTQNFTDATVYVDNELIGVFEIPFKIPILKSGVKLIRIYPTIKNNGISVTKKKYPFVEYYEITANLVQNQTLITLEFFQQSIYLKFFVLNKQLVFEQNSQIELPKLI